MMFYLVVFALLWFALYYSAAKGEISEPLEVMALVVFVLIAGQRFETGNDWLVYRDHYIALQNFGLEGGNSEQFPVFEPLYVLLVWMAGRLFDFQTFLLLVALFNGIVLYRFAKAWRVSFLGVFAIYYAWLYLATQMATIRHSLAISFALLALIAIFKSRKLLAFVLLLVASGMHLFSLAFFALFVLFKRSLSIGWVLASLVGGFVAVYIVLFAVSAGLLSWLPFSEKIALYADVAAVGQLSAGSLAYIALNLAFLFWLMRDFGDDIQSRVAKWSVFYLLFFQIALWMLPVFWNRVQIFTLIIQACVLSKYLIERQRMLTLAGVCVLSLAMLIKFLADPAYISYIPYQSYWVDVLLPGTVRSDGEKRFYEAIDANRERGAK
ncbi:EpsG family protein [Cupriavidus lacunae]|uniref:EpsG family protein n=1 Tax=Cupriavidus lacunae TaxID=2666307 RepID=A0A370P2R0_9BURK|nr:EpsG family protein [Cupriavidus lacunae]RDK12133.1 hypothetical protein DN412_00870 [Cupriavidus lacunae]